jgi:hypothetical protein
MPFCEVVAGLAVSVKIKLADFQVSAVGLHHQETARVFLGPPVRPDDVLPDRFWRHRMSERYI